jgi:hypothetical protein
MLENVLHINYQIKFNICLFHFFSAYYNDGIKKLLEPVNAVMGELGESIVAMEFAVLTSQKNDRISVQ